MDNLSTADLDPSAVENAKAALERAQKKLNDETSAFGEKKADLETAITDANGELEAKQGELSDAQSKLSSAQAGLSSAYDALKDLLDERDDALKTLIPALAAQGAAEGRDFLEEYETAVRDFLDAKTAYDEAERLVEELQEKLNALQANDELVDLSREADLEKQLADALEADGPDLCVQRPPEQDDHGIHRRSCQL